MAQANTNRVRPTMQERVDALVEELRLMHQSYDRAEELVAAYAKAYKASLQNQAHGTNIQGQEIPVTNVNEEKVAAKTVVFSHVESDVTKVDHPQNTTAYTKNIPHVSPSRDKLNAKTEMDKLKADIPIPIFNAAGVYDSLNLVAQIMTEIENAEVQFRSKLGKK